MVSDTKMLKGVCKYLAVKLEAITILLRKKSVEVGRGTIFDNCVLLVLSDFSAEKVYSSKTSVFAKAVDKIERQKGVFK